MLESLCPFLYQTRTLRTYATQQRKRTSKAPIAAVEVVPNENQQQADDGRSLPYRPTFLQQRAAEAGQLSKVSVGLSGTSTLTPAERAAFQNLISKFGTPVGGDALLTNKKPSRVEQSASAESAIAPTSKDNIHDLLQANHDIEIDSILSLFAPETPEMALERQDAIAVTSTKPSSIEEAEEEDPHKPFPAYKVRDAARSALKDISESFRTALESSTNPTRAHLLNPKPKDVLLWNTITSQVFAQIETLRTLNSADPFYQRATLSDIEYTKATPSCLKSLNQEVPLIPLLTILYPASTVLAMRTHLRHLPTSPCALALLPHIKSLGPVSYLLAGNIHFYNALLYLQWTIYSDLPTIKNLLVEMEHNGVERNKGTAAVLGNIKLDKDRDHGLQSADSKEDHGHYLGRPKSWWEAQPQRNSYKSVFEAPNLQPQHSHWR